MSPSSTQPDLFAATITAEDKELLRRHLYAFGWQTRRQLCTSLGWSERKVRDVAESMGADVVRGQSGFKLTDMIQRDSEDFSKALQAANAAGSQGRKQIGYEVALLRRLHAKIG